MATEAEFWGRPFAPGSVKLDPDALAEKARLVREAIALVADEAHDRGALNTFAALEHMVRTADDVALAKLGRLLKHG